MSVSVTEAMEIYHAMKYYHDHRPANVSREHYFDPRPVLMCIRGSICKEHPELHEMWFGPVKDFKPTESCAPVD